MAEGQAQHGEQQVLHQGADDQQGQGEIGGAGGRNHGQADHQEDRDQAVATTQPMAEGQEQAQTDQQYAAEGVVAQYRDQQQPAAGGQHQYQRQAQPGLERQRVVELGQQEQGEDRGNERQRQRQAEADRQAQRGAAGQAQRALGTGVTPGRHERTQ
ncbi:hypothetical protein D3C80_1374080 [compost metagenome]